MGTPAKIGHQGRLPPDHQRGLWQPANSDTDAVTTTTARLGFLAPLTLLAAAGLFAVSVADGASRTGTTWGRPVFWTAIFACAALFAFRLTSSRASRAERIGLVVVFGFFLYLVKVLRDPTQFTQADELAHVWNVNSIVSTHSLFEPSPILPVTASYPGLEMTAAAARLAGGVSTFVAGVTVVALARIVMMLALFLLLERITSSARIAGVGALLYTANPDFLFFDAAFSYESLALPLAVVAVFAVLRWMEIKEADIASDTGRYQLGPRHAWGFVAVAMIVAVVLTHHTTSYVLIVFMLAAGRAQREIRRLSKTYVSPFPFAAFALAATLIWLIYAARPTWGYLSPVITNAVRSVVNTITGHQGGRQLFGPSAHGSDVTPLWDRTVAVAAAAIIAAATPFGLWRVWRDRRAQAVCVVFAVASVAYVGSLGLRLVPEAWEIANRASEFLFMGVALVLALVGIENWAPRFMPWLGRMALALAFAVLLEGGIVSGWSSEIMLAQTSEIGVGRTTIHTQGFVVAKWANAVLGPNQRFAADASNARQLAAFGDEFAIAGGHPDVQAVIREPKLEGWHVRLLRELGIRYVLVDRRRISEDQLSGSFFSTDTSPPSWRDTFDARSVRKFDRQPAVSRLLDSGNIVVYNVGRLTEQRAP